MLTPAGQEVLPNVFYVSPFFVTNGRDEQGNSIGYELLNIAFVNGPFLRGMAPLRMSKTRGINFMADEKMKRYGVDENASADQLRAAMSRYADEVDGDKKRSEEAMSRYRRFADTCGGEERMQRFLDDEEEQKRFRKFMSGGDGEDEDDDKREMSVIAGELGVPAKMSAIRAKLTELRFTSVPKSELAVLKEQLSELKARQAKRDEEEREAATLAFARKAIADRAWDPDDEAGLVAFYRASPEKATEAVERNKKHKTWDRVIAMGRLTSAGAPLGKPEGEVLDLSKSEPADLGKKIDEVARKIAADENVPYSVAMTRVKVKHPQLYAAFVAAR